MWPLQSLQTCFLVSLLSLLLLSLDPILFALFSSLFLGIQTVCRSIFSFVHPFFSLDRWIILYFVVPQKRAHGIRVHANNNSWPTLRHDAIFSVLCVRHTPLTLIPAFLFVVPPSFYFIPPPRFFWMVDIDIVGFTILLLTLENMQPRT